MDASCAHCAISIRDTMLDSSCDRNGCLPEAIAVRCLARFPEDHAVQVRIRDVPCDQAFMISLRHVEDLPPDSTAIRVPGSNAAGCRHGAVRRLAPIAARTWAGSRQGRFRVGAHPGSRLDVEGVTSQVNLAQLRAKWRRRAALATRRVDAADARQVLPVRDANRKLENRPPARGFLPHAFLSSRIAGQSALNVRVGSRFMMSFR